MRIRMSAVLLAEITLDLPARSAIAFDLHHSLPHDLARDALAPTWPTSTARATPRCRRFRSATPSTRPDGVPNLDAAAAGRRASNIRQSSRTRTPCLSSETRQTRAQRCKRLRKNRPQAIDWAPELRFDRRRPISAVPADTAVVLRLMPKPSDDEMRPSAPEDASARMPRACAAEMVAHCRAMMMSFGHLIWTRQRRRARDALRHGHAPAQRQKRSARSGSGRRAKRRDLRPAGMPSSAELAATGGLRRRDDERACRDPRVRERCGDVVGRSSLGEVVDLCAEPAPPCRGRLSAASRFLGNGLRHPARARSSDRPMAPSA